MNVLSFISTNQDFVVAFGAFLDQDKKLVLSSQDDDTRYYAIQGDEKHNWLYFHFLLMTDPAAYSYNFSDGDLEAMSAFAGTEQLYLFDIQYRDESFLKELLTDFDHYLMQNKKPWKFLVHHPFHGFILLNSV